MKIILVDFETAGHHIFHINIMAAYCLKQGDEVTFITWREDRHIERVKAAVPDCEIKFVNRKKQRPFSKHIFRRYLDCVRGFGYCWRFAEQWRADIVHVMSVNHNQLGLFISLLSSFRPRLGKTKIFATLITPYFLKKNYGNSLGSLFKYLRHNWHKGILKRLLSSGLLEKLFVLSEQTKNILLRCWPELTSQNVQAVPDPIIPFTNMCSQKEVRKQLRLPLGGAIFLYFGALRKDKGPDIFLKTAPFLKGNFWHVLVGKPKYISQKDIMEQKRNMENPGKLIARLGFVSDDDMKMYFLAADVIVLPYRKNYLGTSGILQNAAGAGKIVIASDVDQIGEIVKNKRLGLVVEPESVEKLARTMDTIISGQVQMNDFKKNIQQYVEEHHYLRMAEKVRQGYVNPG